MQLMQIKLYNIIKLHNELLNKIIILEKNQKINLLN